MLTPRTRRRRVYKRRRFVLGADNPPVVYSALVVVQVEGLGALAATFVVSTMMALMLPFFRFVGGVSVIPTKREPLALVAA